MSPEVRSLLLPSEAIIYRWWSSYAKEQRSLRSVRRSIKYKRTAAFTHIARSASSIKANSWLSFMSNFISINRSISLLTSSIRVLFMEEAVSISWHLMSLYQHCKLNVRWFSKGIFSPSAKKRVNLHRQVIRNVNAENLVLEMRIVESKAILRAFVTDDFLGYC